MPERKQVNVKIAPEAKERWQEYADESLEVNSMSDLVRLSVEKEIQGDTGESGSESNSEHLESISRTLNDIQNNIGQLENRLSRIETSTQEDPEINKLANDIFQYLPDKEPGTDAWQIERNDKNDELEAIEEGHIDRGDSEEARKRLYGWEGTTESFADIFEVTELDARKALEKLVSDMSGRVRVTEHEGKERYWRDV
ncbi:hypothetical protein [Halorubrum sp. Atlit-26R]|uniref:hypothetical protein n=1 Tax=Halorubrum sp. Atlit-26R TaxID=2282128 RepID=UPI0011C3B31C|nr:hypothetical protein [Halorubrum sp. Atlit-26R]